MLILPTLQLPANSCHSVPEGDVRRYTGSQEDQEMAAIFNKKSLALNRTKKPSFNGTLSVPRNVFFPLGGFIATWINLCFPFSSLGRANKPHFIALVCNI